MVLLVDIGNTCTSYSFYENEHYTTYTVSSTKTMKKDEVIFEINRSVPSNYLKGKCEGIVLCSVVPELTLEIKEAVEEVFKTECIVVSPGVKNSLAIKIDNPSELGSDLVADCVGCKETYGYPSIIVDLGTATKILALDKNGAYIGGVIAPGIKISVKALNEYASLLPMVDCQTPKKVIGRNTIDSMNSAFTYGCADMILGLVKRFEDETGYKMKHILTGGNARYVVDLLGDSFIYDKDLVIKGLLAIYRRNAK